jgi:hypothetical protein
VPVWYVAPLEMNEGTHWGQGYNRSIRLQCRRRPNKATFKKELLRKPSKFMSREQNAGQNQTLKIVINPKKV